MEIETEMRVEARIIVELVPSIYLVVIKKELYKEKRKGNRIVAGYVL
jgi:hypothetical protein